MSSSALIMMLCAWAIIIFFALKFFIKVLKNPEKEE